MLGDPDQGITHFFAVPAPYQFMMQHPDFEHTDLSRLRIAGVGGAPCALTILENWYERGVSIMQGFGMTELSPVSHVVPGNAPRSGAAGFVIPNTVCKIVDLESGDALPEGREGEIWVKGPQVMQGYLNNPKATAETITDDGWLRTGDIAYVDAYGYLFIVDRLKELIKYKGFQVAPAELEATLVALDGIIDAAVIGLPDEEGGELPIAFVIRTENGPDEASIRAHFTAQLATYKQLHQIRFVDEIPKSASGKILRRLLRDQIAQEG